MTYAQYLAAVELARSLVSAAQQQDWSRFDTLVVGDEGHVFNVIMTVKRRAEFDREGVE